MSKRNLDWSVVAVLSAAVVVLSAVGYQLATWPPEPPSDSPLVATMPVPEPVVELLDAATTVAFLGDSYTAGAGATAPPNVYARLVASEQGWSLTNLGQGATGYISPGPGPTTTPFTARVDDVVAVRPDVVIVQGSLNDFGAEDRDIEEAARSVFSGIREGLPDAAVLVMGPTDPKDSPNAKRAIAAVRRAAAANGMPFVNTESWLSDGSLLAEDGLHPNDKGHARLADGLNGFIQSERELG